MKKEGNFDVFETISANYAEQELLEAIFRNDRIKKAADKAEKIVAALLDEKQTPESIDKLILKNPIDVFTLWDILNKGSELDSKARARLAALARLENDPKQKALKEIKLHYLNSKNQFKRRGYGAQFIREMHAKYPVIVDSDSIKKLVTKLKKANELLPVS